MHSSSAVRDAVSSRLDLLLVRMRAETIGYGPEAALLLDAAERTLRGGKRLRARFCHAGWCAVARATDPGAIPPASLWELCAALEVFQAAALVHDDLIDNSDVRRGMPAAHRALEGSHRERGWTGDPGSFGRSAALLLGDLLVAWSDDVVEAGLEDSPHAADVRREYARMRRDVTIGQFLDIAEESAWSSAPDEDQAERALRIVSLKSARYSVEQPLILGALLAGADGAQQQALRDFGHPIGVAFQLRDDVLGVYGDEKITGKPSGDDLREGKRTVLVAFAREALDPAARASFDAALGDPDLDDGRVRFLQEQIVASGALDRVEGLIGESARAADAALGDARLDPETIEGLRELAAAATERTS